MNWISLENIFVFIYSLHLTLLASLIELLINKNSQGSIKSIGKRDGEENPLDRKKKRKRNEGEDIDKDSTQNISQEIERVFGSHDQPIMDKFLFKVYKG